MISAKEKDSVCVVGAGYVGLASAVLWSASHDVTVLDVLPEKVAAVNDCICPFKDTMIDGLLSQRRSEGCPLQAKLNEKGALQGFDIVLVAVPTDFDEANGRFDACFVESAFAQIACECSDALVVLRSTVQPKTTATLARTYGLKHVVYCPEFLREGRSLDDCLHPSRVVVGSDDGAVSNRARNLLEDVYSANEVPIPPILLCSTEEAEASKLFSNAYLANRIAFFNELDSFAMHNNLDTAKIIQAVGFDPRIGTHYNNPSFGFGGYCLPKDSKALLSSFGDDVPHDLIAAVVASNESRMSYLVRQVASLKPNRVGVYRLLAKHGSDNLRNSALSSMVPLLVAQGLDVVVYEPLLDEEVFVDAPVTHDLATFFDTCDVLIANRLTDELQSYQGTLVTRDVFHCD